MLGFGRGLAPYVFNIEVGAMLVLAVFFIYWQYKTEPMKTKGEGFLYG